MPAETFCPCSSVRLHCWGLQGSWVKLRTGIEKESAVEHTSFFLYFTYLYRASEQQSSETFWFVLLGSLNRRRLLCSMCSTRELQCSSSIWDAIVVLVMGSPHPLSWFVQKNSLWGPPSQGQWWGQMLYMTKFLGGYTVQVLLRSLRVCVWIIWIVCMSIPQATTHHCTLQAQTEKGCLSLSLEATKPFSSPVLPLNFLVRYEIRNKTTTIFF